MLSIMQNTLTPDPCHLTPSQLLLLMMNTICRLDAKTTKSAIYFLNKTSTYNIHFS